MTAMTHSLKLENISAHYGKTQVLKDLDLQVREGELVSLLGSSGCGKTTTLRLVAGFLAPTQGTITLGDKDLTKQPAHKRDIGLVFQNYALFPHLNVRDNVAFGLKQRGLALNARYQKADQMIERIGLTGFAERYPANLSGGQRQRVALARALVIEPPLLMFDEPLSNLDAKLRVDMRVEIRRLQQANGTTALYVTHDQEEAFSISDRVAIMNKGKIMQLDRPEVLYTKPANQFVADFVGFENMMDATLVAQKDDQMVVDISGTHIELPKAFFAALQTQHKTQDGAFVLASRADGLKVTQDGAGIPARLGLRTYLGRAYQYVCDTAAGTFIANGSLSEPLEPGAHVKLVPNLDQSCILPKERA